MLSSTTISEDEFAQTFQPLRNHLNPHASFDWGDGFGTLFETFGQEAVFVSTQPPEHIWTLVDTDEGLCIASGYHFVNRLGYFVTKHPTPIEDAYEVPLETTPE